MYFLNKKSERKRFWIECEKSLEQVSALNKNIFSWYYVGKKLDGDTVLKFWEACTFYWTKYNIKIPKNILDTFEYYKNH